MMKKPDEFRIPVETGKIPLELTAQMKWNIAETISRIHDNGIVLGAGDFVDVDDLKYICQATSYLLLYAQQLEAERDAAVKCIGKLTVILKTYPYAATNCCAYEAYKEIEKYTETVRGVQKEDEA